MRYHIYTVNINQYDNIYKHNIPKGVNFVSISDVNISEPTIYSRYFKMFPHIKDIKEGDIVMYMDSSFEITGEDITGWMDKQLKDYDIVFNPSLKVADCYEDMKRSLNLGKGDYKVLKEQEAAYRREGVPEKRNQPQGGLFIYRESKKVRKFMKRWWNEFILYPSRDQVALYKLLHTKNYVNWSYINPYTVANKVDPELAMFNYHPHKKESIHVYYSTPYGNNKDLGSAYNTFCEAVPNDNDWICLMDGDVMFLTSNWGDIVTDAIREYPDTGIFGCYTNRLALEWQLHEGKVSDDFNILNHQKIAEQRAEEFWAECDTIDKPIAGLFMLFQKKHWKEHKFKKGIFSVEDRSMIDWLFTSSFKERGLPIRLIKGLYLFHGYRLGKDITDISHLT